MVSAATRVALAWLDGPLSPSAFRARTSKVYAVPFVRLATGWLVAFAPPGALSAMSCHAPYELRSPSSAGTGSEVTVAPAVVGRTPSTEASPNRRRGSPRGSTGRPAPSPASRSSPGGRQRVRRGCSPRPGVGRSRARCTKPSPSPRPEPPRRRSGSPSYRLSATPVTARETPSTVTVNADGAGSEPASRSSS